ncbi:MAG: hypothetical protein JJ979_19870 [Roseibium sp.]|nr:hypothetical protein [Roseibium sp.]
MSDDNSEYYKAPRASHASRTVTLKSSFSSRGFLWNHTSLSWAGYESTLERDFLTILNVRSDVKLWQEQPEPVTYVDDQGKRRKHTFDVSVHLFNGETVACDVKPQKRLVRSGIEEVHRLIRRQHPDYADKFLIRTDRHISRALVRNAELLLRARTLRDEDSIDELRRHLISMHGVYRLASLVALLNDQAAGFNAVLNLIDSRELKPVTRGSINDNIELEICKAV